MGRKRRRKGRRVESPQKSGSPTPSADDLDFVDDRSASAETATPRTVAPKVAGDGEADPESAASPGQASQAVSKAETSKAKTSKPEKPEPGGPQRATTPSAKPGAQAHPPRLDGESRDQAAGGPAVAKPPRLEEMPSKPTAQSPEPSGSGVQTLGELLQQAREDRGISLEEASARTRINSINLRHLEHDRFTEIPAETYIKGFLRSYGTLLGLDVGMLIRRYESFSGSLIDPQPEVWEEVAVQKSNRRVWRPQKRSVMITGGLIFTAALGWVFWSQGATRLGLRPADELQRIEDELRSADQDTHTGFGEAFDFSAGLPDVPATQAPGAAAATTAADSSASVVVPEEPKEDAAPKLPEKPKEEVETKNKKRFKTPPPKRKPPPKREPEKEEKRPTSPEDAAGPPLWS